MSLHTRDLCVLVLACTLSTDSVRSLELSAAEYDVPLWSFQAVQAVNPPETREKDWGRAIASYSALNPVIIRSRTSVERDARYLFPRTLSLTEVSRDKMDTANLRNMADV